MMRLGANEILRTLLAAALLVGAAAVTVGLIGESGRLKGWQTDLAELNDVRYGLLDADNWVEQISDILDRRIDGFELTAENRPLIKRNVERVLDRLLEEIEDYQRRRNSIGDSWAERIEGALRQEVQDYFLDFDELRAKVPVYAEAILEELAKPGAKAEIKQYLKTSIADLATSTFSRTDRSAFQAVLERHDCANAMSCQELLASRIERSQHTVAVQAIAAIVLVVLLFLTSLYHGSDLSGRNMLLLTAATLVLLAGGVLTPMIGIEARITELRLQLLGEPVLFQNQVLYFQSKSVTDVMAVLARTRKADLILVASLVGLFSVLFPLGKVAASYLYYRDVRGLRRSPLVRFFA
ncbi:MAG: paraquat-inducible protein A, partial [Chromatiaceae bacterium]|nr:paraquat-inducible protein A [Chromatiaceae bacterium]